LVSDIIEIQDGLLVIKINGFWGKIFAFKSKITIPLVTIDDDVITDPVTISRTISGSFRILGTSFGNYHGGLFFKKGRGMSFFSFKTIDRRSIMLIMEDFYKYKIIIVIEVQDKEKTHSIIRKAIGNSS
jgi:hypothetical protein